jgi:hypothetical protein
MGLFALGLLLPVLTLSLHRQSRRVGDDGIGRAGLVLLQLQTVLPLPLLMVENLSQGNLQHLARSSSFALPFGLLLMLGYGLAIPVMLLCLLSKQTRIRTSGCAISLACCLYLFILTVIGSAAA